MKLSLITTSFLAFALNSSITQAQMMGLGFENITNKLSGIDISNQLSAEFYDSGSAATKFGQTIATNEILFTFTNNVSATVTNDGYQGYTANFSEIYFQVDNTNNYSQTEIINNLGGFTDFSSTINPADLPSDGSAVPEFITTDGYGADAKGNTSNTLDSSSDILGIIIQLHNGYTFSHLQDDIVNGALRLGLHVRAIDSTAISDSFVNTDPFAIAPASPVPLPAAAWLFGPALLVAARKRKTS